MSRFCKTSSLIWSAMTLIILLASASTFCQTVDSDNSSADNRIAAGFESDLASKYVWRGLAFSSGAVSQSSAWISKSGFTGSVWSNYDIGTVGADPRLNEVDFALLYETSIYNFDIQNNLQAYTYPNQSEIPTTAEISINLTYGSSIIQPFTIQTFDIKAYSGAYYGEFGLQTSRDIGDRFTATMMAELGWGSAKFNRAYIGDSGFTLELASYQADLTCNLSQAFYIRPHFCASTLIGQDIRNQVEKSTLFQIGIAVGGEF